jgi:hypothetical protein
MDPPTNDRLPYTKPAFNQLPSPSDFIKPTNDRLPYTKPAFNQLPSQPDFIKPTNDRLPYTKPAFNQLPSQPEFIKPPPITPPGFVESAKDVVERLLPLLNPRELQNVRVLLDIPTGLINPASRHYTELMEIKKQINKMSEEDKQYLKTLIGDEPAKDVLERLISDDSLSLEDLQFVARLLDYPDEPINPTARNYRLLVEIKDQIPLLTEEDKQSLKTSLSMNGGRRRKRTKRKRSRKSRKSRARRR